jgi:hypothetical protein
MFATACANVEQPRPSPVTGACVRSFRAVLTAWEANSRERVPEECAFLDAEYELELLGPEDNVSCSGEPLARGLVQIGCTRPELRLISLLDRGDDQVAMVDASVHEWLHATLDCVLGDPDYEHLRAGVWAAYGPQSTEMQAFANAEIGECL